MHCRLYLTGRLVVEAPGGTLAQEGLPGRQGRLAIAHLALARSQPVEREALAATLWPGTAPAALDLALSAVVSKIRKGLADIGLPGVLHSVAGCYELRLPPACWVDVEVAARELDQAEDSPWVTQQRARLEATYRLLIRAHLAQGNRAEALLAYHRCRDLLVSELGVEPAPATRAVYADALRQGEPGLRNPPA